MRFSREIYKAALDKIDRPSNHHYSQETEYIERIYKEAYMKNEIVDTFAGFDAETFSYDREMLKKENLRKLLFSVAALLIGIIVLVFSVVHICQNVLLKTKAQSFRLQYVSESEYCKRTDEKTGINYYDGYVSVISQMEETDNLHILYGKSYGEVTLWYLYSHEDIIQISKLNFQVNDTFVERVYELGYRPKQIVASIDGNVPDKYIIKKNRYADVFYFPDKGETIKDLRLAERNVIYVICAILSMLYDAFWIRRVVRIGLEEKRLDRSFDSGN